MNILDYMGVSKLWGDFYSGSELTNYSNDLNTLIYDNITEKWKYNVKYII